MIGKEFRETLPEKPRADGITSMAFLLVHKLEEVPIKLQDTREALAARVLKGADG